MNFFFCQKKLIFSRDKISCKAGVMNIKNGLP